MDYNVTREDRAFAQGQTAKRLGLGKEANPYGNEHENRRCRASWFAGYKKGGAK